MKTHTLGAFLAVVASTLALYISPPPQQSTRSVDPMDESTANFQDIPTPSGEYLTIRIHNTMDENVHIHFVTSAGTPEPLGNPEAGHLAPNSSQNVFFCPKWSGQFTLNKENETHAAGTKIEGSYKVRDDKTYIDVSLVDGYTFPATCFAGSSGASNLRLLCHGDECPAEHAADVMTGCNKDLFQLGECEEVEDGVCINDALWRHPNRASAFFEPCQGAAYTFPSDDSANEGRETDVVDCCIGSRCPTKEHDEWRCRMVGSSLKCYLPVDDDDDDEDDGETDDSESEGSFE